MEKMWKNYDKWCDKCYMNMMGADKDFTVWEKTFQILLDNVREEQKKHPGKRRDFYELEDELDYSHNISGWIEDYLDELDMFEKFEELVLSCNELN